MWKYLLYGIIIAIHLAIVSLLFMGDNLNQSGKKAPKPETLEESANTGENNLSPEQSPPGKQTRPPYSPNYYLQQNATLPAELNRLVSNCNAAAIIDPDQKVMLWGKNVTQPYPLASLTKMMTVLLAMEEVTQGNKGITLETTVKVTKEATKIGVRQVWLDLRETFTIDELLKCALIRSANDCTYLLAEFLGGGSHDNFVSQMNTRARQLGCQNFVFYNAHGLPDEKTGKENQGSVLELAYLAECLWQYPEVMKWTATRQEFIRENTKKPFQLDTTNSLLRTCPGVNGMKTGMTNKAGYCIVVTCEREQKRLIAIVMGVSGRGGDKIRDDIAKRLIEWAYKK
ncbi:MAG: D-alanyl-D-alanine carboxypeptidase [Lentisphaerae bacterium]|jgi:D-alanyl-D-alanine carboxypeptidase (penicillin-binding protein 5/6)|nr:D-alanyl-D-alanine carboxypeptidase [Lentisphaerota bacterium]